jgi:hypothetical protein
MSLKEQLQQFQDERENAGWRIRLIPFDDTDGPRMVESNWIANVGGLGFIGGAVMIVLNPGIDPRYLAGMMVGCLVLALFGTWFKSRRQRRNWVIATARCVDRELRKFHRPKSGGRDWFWRIVCEYEYQGEKHRVTPDAPQWVNFSSEEAVMKFIGENIAPDGTCKLHVNPQNPLQTELVSGDLREKLLYTTKPPASLKKACNNV